MLQHLLLSCVLLLCPLLAHCVSFAQSPPRIPDTLAVQAYREGKELYTQGKYLRALEKYAQALADESTLTQATAADYWHHRAHALASSGAYREAVQAFEASLTRYAASGRVDESLMNTRICMVSLYLNFGEIEKARVLIDENDRFFKEDYQIRNLFQSGTPGKAGGLM